MKSASSTDGTAANTELLRLHDEAVMSKFVTKRECEAYRRAVDDCMLATRGRLVNTRKDIVTVPRSLAERSHSMFQSVDPSGSIASEWRDVLDLPRFP